MEENLPRLVEAAFPTGPEILVMLRLAHNAQPVLAVNTATGELCLDRTHFTEQESQDLMDGIEVVVHKAFDHLLTQHRGDQGTGKGFRK